MKRRYSTRFNNLPPGFDVTAPPIPSLPTLQNQYGSPNDRGRGPSPGKAPGLMVDVKALRDPNLRPEQCELHSKNSLPTQY